MQTKSNIFLWTLYDFANSLVSVVFFLYFAQWIVIDQGVSDIYFNITFTVAAILLLLTVPLTGTLLDKSHRRISGLRITTVAMGVLFGACAFCAITHNNIGALIFYTLGLYSYMLSFTFYTPLLNDIAPENKRGFVSGLGISANYVGQFVGLLIALPFSSGSFSLFHANPRAETLLPSVIIFLLFSLPMLFFFKEPMKKKVTCTIKQHIKDAVEKTKSLLLVPGVGLFILSYFLFNDAILTAVNNFPIFLEQVWHISDLTKTKLMLGILVTCAIGGIVGGFVADKLGHKKTLICILIGWILVLPLIGILTNFTIFVIAAILMGLWFGASWTVSRSVMGYLAPEGKHNLAFAYFGLAERASSLLGPIFWGLIVSNLIWMGSYRYNIAIIALTVFIIFGLIALIKTKSDRK